ncbi:MAG: hypothetical protein LBJ94_01400 [Puniceicoccales bacterium]|nr:hypothetical protein [Puniceicoccales bacterium]
MLQPMVPGNMALRAALGKRRNLLACNKLPVSCAVGEGFLAVNVDWERGEV